LNNIPMEERSYKNSDDLGTTHQEGSGREEILLKTFNTSVICNPKKHYMVDISDRIDRIIKKYIEPGKYFSINRGRQYGKTTTLSALARKLSGKYYCISISFAWADGMFETESKLVSGFIGLVKKELKVKKMPEEMILHWSKEINESQPFVDLDERITGLCADSDREIVLMIDEVDKASDNQLMIQLLSLLRDKYILREDERDVTFKSVILAGVYDVENLKQKIRPESEHKYNSPWNVAVKFEEDLAFSAEDISQMLAEYEQDYQTGMDIAAISGMIYDFTSGYPVLVSEICKILDETIPGTSDFPERKDTWTPHGIMEAVKIIQHTRTPLFEDMIKQVEDYPELKEMLKSILFEGAVIAFNNYNYVLNLAKMFDYIKSTEDHVAVANRIFELVLYDYFLSEEELDNATNKDAILNRSCFVLEGKLDMEAVLRKFADHYKDIYTDSDQKFVEKYGRKLFLMYLKPIINGTGNYYIEAETRDAKRTDIIVDYRGMQYVIETKLWYGPKYHADGEKQLCGYLDKLHLDAGYMLTFRFNKNKETGITEKIVAGKKLFEVTV